MDQRHNHIISRLRWSTAFDNKALASDLQQQISHWSHNNMPRQAGHVFDQVCPYEQTWKIDALELDLGIIYYDELKSKLNTNLPRLLKEKLIDLILHSNENSNDIEVINISASQLAVLKVYLLQGFMPWYYNRTYGSVQQIMLRQLQQNSRELRLTLMDIGRNKKVRQRIAWQFNTETIKGIIKVVEPIHYRKIIKFSDTLVKVQDRTNLVKTSSSNFRKQLWFWVFNHLFVERGTLFNMVDFVKSSLRQMASHYNLKYNELLHLISETVKQADLKDYVGNTIVSVLKILSEDDAIQPEQTRTEDKTDYWERLKQMFLQPDLRRAKSEKETLNELILSLSVADEYRFEKLVTSFEKTMTFWSDVINDISDDALEAVYKGLLPSRYHVIVAGIRGLSKISHKTQLISPGILRHKGMQFLLEHSKKAFDRRQFLLYCIDELTEDKAFKPADLLEKLIYREITAASDLLALDTVQDLTALWQSEITEKGRLAFNEHFRQIMEQLHQALHAEINDKEERRQLTETFLGLIRMQPQWAFKALTHHKDQTIVIEVLAYTLDVFHTERLLKYSDNQLGQLLLTLLQEPLFYEDSNKYPEYLITGLKLIIEKPKRKPVAFIKMLFTVHGNTDYRKPKHLTGYLEQVKTVMKLTGHDYKALITWAEEQVAVPTIEAIIEAIRKPDINQIEIAGKLEALIHREHIGFTKLMSPEQHTEILNYLIPDGAVLYQKLADTDSKTQVRKAKIFWQCAVDVKSHKNDIPAFEKHYMEAVGQQLDDISERFTEDKAYDIGGNRLTKHQLISEIRSILLSQKTPKSSNSTSELIRAGLEITPSDVRNIIESMHISRQHINIFRKVAPFDELTAWIISDTCESWTEGIRALSSAYQLVTQLSGKQITGALLDTYWKTTLKIVKTKTINISQLSRIVQDTMVELINTLQTDFEQVLREIREQHIAIPELLRVQLVKFDKRFTALKADNPANDLPETLKICIQKGNLENLVHHLWMRKQVPAWFSEFHDDPDVLLLMAIKYDPLVLFKIVKHHRIRLEDYGYILRIISIQELMSLIAQMAVTHRYDLERIKEFMLVLIHIAIPGVSYKYLQQIVLRQTFNAWISGRWNLLTAQHVLNEIAWRLYTQRSITKQQMLGALKEAGPVLPPAFQTAVHMMAEPVTQHKQIEEDKLEINANKIIKSIGNSQGITGSIPVKNAGLVLINNYVQMLFDRLGLTENKVFKIEDSRLDAVHYLQYVATGKSNTEEAYLPLNKIMCGLQISDPVKDGVTITDDQIKTIDSMIQAIIGYWPAIGESSVNGFRGNWLVRDGLLVEQEDKWELTVEKKAYDILINKSPFSFSIVRYPWMDKPMHVVWPY